jgi:hypothetical protein
MTVSFIFAYSQILIFLIFHEIIYYYFNCDFLIMSDIKHLFVFN